MRTILQSLAWAIPGLPLLIYPGILMAGIMGLAAHPRPDADPIKMMVARSFLVLSLLYPITFGVGCAVWASGFRRISYAIVWGNLILCLGLFGAWYGLSK